MDRNASLPADYKQELKQEMEQAKRIHAEKVMQKPNS